MHHTKLALGSFVVALALVACGGAVSHEGDDSGPALDAAGADAARDAVPASDVSAADQGAPDVPAAARCGDGTVEASEQCDDGPANAAGAPCNERCRFPERVVNTTATGAASKPALAWGMGQPLVVGFEAQSTVWVHYFDSEGAPRVSTRDDVALASPSPSARPSDLSLAATTSGFAVGCLGGNVAYGGIVEGFPSTRFTGWFEVDPARQILYRATPPRVAVGRVVTKWLFRDRDSAGGGLHAFGVTTAQVIQPPLEVGFESSYTSEPQIVAAGDDFIAAWTTTTGGASDVMAIRLVSNETQPLPVTVAAGPGDQHHPALAARGTDVVIAWQEADAIRWQLFDARLAPVGAPVVVPASVGMPVVSPPTVAIDDHRTVLVAWASDSDGVVRGQLFRLAGRAPAPNPFDGTTGAFEIDAAAGESGHTAGPRTNPVATFGGAGRFAVAWEDLSTASRASIHLRVMRGP